MIILGATALLAIPGHVALVAVGRILQGLSAAAIWTSGMALLTETFGGAHFGEVIGYVMMSVSIANTIAPLLGGVLYSRGGYQAVSFMTLAVVAVDVVMRLLMVDPKRRHGRYLAVNGQEVEDPDYKSDVGSAERGSNPKTQALSSNEREPLLPKMTSKERAAHGTAYLKLLRSKRILADLWGIFTFACLMISLETLLPFFVSRLFGWTPTQAGLMFLSWIVPGFLSPIAGRCSDRFGSRWIVIGAFLFAIPALILMRLITEHTLSHEVLLCTLLTLVGTCRLNVQLTDGTC